MLDYLIAHQQIVFAWMFGGFCGTIMSIAIDNSVLNLYEARGEERATIISAVVQGIKISLLASLLSTIFVIIDYWLSFAPLAFDLQTITKDGLITGFTFAFLCAMSNTIIIASERAISSRNQN